MVDSELLAEFMNITGTTDEEYAKELLISSNLDLGESLAQHFAIQEAGGTVPIRGGGGSGGGNGNGAHSGSSSNPSSSPTAAEINADFVDDDDDNDSGEDRRMVTQEVEAERAAAMQRDAELAAALEAREREAIERTREEIRAPIAQRVQTLVHERRVNRNGAALREGIELPFGDQENPTGENIPITNNNNTASQGVSGIGVGIPAGSMFDGLNIPRRTGLNDMYRTPQGLTFHGTLERAMQEGVREGKWILVNIQAHDEFKCHILNRDVWSDEMIKTIISSSFIMWQRYTVSADGEKYKTYYPFESLPHIAILDPRTGERLISWDGGGSSWSQLGKENLIMTLTDFLDHHSLEGDTLGPLHRKKSNHLRNMAALNKMAGNSGLAGNGSGADPMDMDEDAQMAAAIAMSMQDQGGDNNNHNNNNNNNTNNNDSSNGIGLGPSSGHGNANAVPGSGTNAVPRRENIREPYSRSWLPVSSDPKLNEERDIRRMQDEEYQMALALDRSREDEQRQAEQMAMQASLDEERRASEMKSRKERKRATLPAEPPAADKTSKKPVSNSTTQLAIRLPSGERLTRRFNVSDTVRHVFDYIEIESGIAEETFELVSTFPKKNFSVSDDTLAQAGLVPNANLNVHIK